LVETNLTQTSTFHILSEAFMLKAYDLGTIYEKPFSQAFQDRLNHLLKLAKTQA